MDLAFPPVNPSEGLPRYATSEPDEEGEEEHVEPRETKPVDWEKAPGSLYVNNPMMRGPGRLRRRRADGRGWSQSRTPCRSPK